MSILKTDRDDQQPDAIKSQLTIIVIAKECVPGKVKTRLSPPLSLPQAAKLAAASLRDTLCVVRGLPASRRMLVFDGAIGRHEAVGFQVVRQVSGTLDLRLAAAFAACSGPTLLVGMDTPQLTREILAPVLSTHAWQKADAWFGPARDGGFWALALAEPNPDLLLGVPMSVPYTGFIQRRRLAEAGLRVANLPLLRDVDTLADAVEVAELAPHTTFGRTFATIRNRPARFRAHRTVGMHPNPREISIPLPEGITIN